MNEDETVLELGGGSRDVPEFGSIRRGIFTASGRLQGQTREFCACIAHRGGCLCCFVRPSPEVRNKIKKRGSSVALFAELIFPVIGHAIESLSRLTARKGQSVVVSFAIVNTATDTTPPTSAAFGIF